MAGRPVDERRTEQEHGGAEAPHDQVLEPRFQRAHDVHVDGAEDVQRDREPLEAEEQRHQVVRRDQEDHSGARRGEQCEELAGVFPAAAPGIGDGDTEEAGAGDDHLRERGQLVALDGARDDGVPVGAVVVEDARGDQRAHEAERADDRGELLLEPLGHEDGEQHRDRRCGQEDELRRERGPVDRRRMDHGVITPWVTGRTRCWRWPVGRSATSPDRWWKRSGTSGR